MRLRSLKLQNFRGFETFGLELDEAMTVLVGENAAGKSSILDAIAITLTGYISAFPEIGTTGGRKLGADDVRLLRSARLDVFYATPVEIRLSGELRSPDGSTHFPVWTEVRRAGLKGRSSWASDLLHAAAHETVRLLGTGMANIALPLLAHYSAGRLWSVRRDLQAKQAKLRSRGSGYLDALGPGSNPALVAGWMKSLETQRLQTKGRIDDGRAAGDDPAALGEVLAAQRALDRALERAVPTFPAIWFDVDEARDELWVKRDDGTSLPLSALSDGYRTLVGLVVDIAARAHRLNPQLGERAAAEIEGVVLIDEIDLHLHPKLQQTVLARLREAFPKLQFVVTTHAPQVIGSCEARWLRVLKPGAIEPEHVGHARGLDVNTVLRDIMDAPYRDPKATALIADLTTALDDEDLPRARPLLTALAELVGENDREVVRQRWQVADLESRPGNEHAPD
jgi:predicted ATP-binding protein involved in virulence